MNHAKIAKAFRQITPWDSGAITIQYRLHKQPVVLCWTAYRTFPAWQQPLNPLPLIILQQPVAPCSHVLKLFGRNSLAYNQFDDRPYDSVVSYVSTLFKDDGTRPKWNRGCG